ncbi:hypothetical protein J3F84DRAFT_48808 [Trichoderma pleuroticola]
MLSILSCVFCLCTRPLLLFSSSRLVCEASAFEGLVLLQAARAGWSFFSILSLLAAFFLLQASAFVVLVSGTDFSIVHRPAPSPVVFVAVARSFGLDFDLLCLSFLHSLLAARNYVPADGACNRSFLVDSTWTSSPVLDAQYHVF